MFGKKNTLKILILTGNQTFVEIYQICKKFNSEDKSGLHLDVGVIDTPVSAFITKTQVKRFIETPSIIKKISGVIQTGLNSIIETASNASDLNTENLSQSSLNIEYLDITDSKGYISGKYGMILLPGFVPWDASSISDEFNIPIYKGTRFLGDLPDLFRIIKNISLSHKQAADGLINRNLSNVLNELISKEISDIKKRRSSTQSVNAPRLIPYENVVQCNNKQILYCSSNLPPLMFAEIVNAPKLKESLIFEKIEHYLNSGADVIDIGTIFGQDDSDFLQYIIPKIREKFNCPISVDSVDIKEIKTALMAGTDFILSIDDENIDKFLELIDKGDLNRPDYPVTNVGLVLVPLTGDNHYPGKDQQSRFEILTKLSSKLIKRGFNNLFYDLLLKTPIKPGFTPSLIEFHQFRQFLKQTNGIDKPFFMGFNNVFELIDADSPGINALLTTIAMELGVGGILTTEYSAKSIGAVVETKKAIDLMYLAKMKRVPPINLGLNAFNFKSKIRSVKRTREAQSKIMIESGQIKEITVNIEDFTKNFNLKNPQDYKFVEDRNGYFQVYVDHHNNKIELLFFPSEEFKQKNGISPGINNILISGDNAEEIYKTLLQLPLISEISHAIYLGKELSRAESALKHNTFYQEDI